MPLLSRIGLALFLVFSASSAQAQTSDLCEGLLEELLIAVDRGGAAVERRDSDSAIETFFWVEEAAGALEESCRDHLPRDVLAWLADTRVSALVQVRQWDLAVDEAEACLPRYGDEGYCWLSGGEAYRALDRPEDVARMLEGFEENRSERLPAAFDALAVRLERWLNRRGDDPAPALATLGRSAQLLLQRLLEASGHDPGEPDGVIGPQTLEALERFYADSESDAPAIPLTLLSFSEILFDFEPLLLDEPAMIAALEPARAEIEPFFEAPELLRRGAGVLIGRDGRILTALDLVEDCPRIEARIDLPRHEAFPIAARLDLRDAEAGVAVLASNLRTGYWARFQPLSQEGDEAGMSESELSEISVEQGALAQDSASEGLLVAGYPLYGPLSQRFAARYAGGSLSRLAGGLQLEWLGAPVLNARGQVAGLVTSGPDGLAGADVAASPALAIREALLEQATELAAGDADDPILSPADQTRLARLMTVKIDCFAN